MSAVAVSNGEINAQSVQLGLAFPDLLKPGALATVSYLRPFDVQDGRDFLISGGGDGAVQEEWEISYRYPLTSSIALVPSFYWIRNANNFGDNPDIYVFNLQTQLSF
ncbi:MAG: carbohydrate porin [Leptolyngbya sp. SIO4C1]|nr:carbohydrate porin [Leptolyngbya sp. SIO4C1]